MKKLLILTHPNLGTSRINAKLLNAVKEDNLVDTIVDLYKEYPNFNIDVKKEQSRVVEHDVIIFQHPIFWYTSPPLLHHWMNLVVGIGFAYGNGGDKMENKIWQHVVTTGSGDFSYKSGAHNNFTLSEFLRPFQQTANFCRMKWLPIFAVQGAQNNGTGKPISDEELDIKIKEYKQLLSSIKE